MLACYPEHRVCLEQCIQSQHANTHSLRHMLAYAHTHKHARIRMARWASILRLSLMTKNPQSAQHGLI